jgi:hypothetical protein
MKSINNSKYTFEIYKINIKDIRISKLKKLKKLKKIKKDE